MAQATNRDNAKQATDAAKAGVDRTTDLAKEAVTDTTAKVTASTEAALDKGRAVADQAGAPMVRLVLDQAAPAMRDLVKAEGDLATFWIGLAREQVQFNIETAQRLAATRDWREAMEIQTDYLRQSMARMGDGLTRQMELAGSMTSRFMAAGEKLKKAA